MAEISTEQVWQEIEKQLFAVLGMVTERQEARTVGIVYVIHERKFYISTMKSAWKARHIDKNPHVSVTIPIAKRIPFLPWIKIPAATITFSGSARLLEATAVPQPVIQKLFRGLEITPDTSPPYAIIEVTPEKEFITYGVGVPLMTMRDTERARGRVKTDD